MKISPQLQWLLYGTAVSVSVTIGGALWHSRSTPGGHAKVNDFIEIYQSCLEKTMATEYWTGNPTNFPPAPAVYTNRVVNWIPDPSGRGYYLYPTNGSPVWTNYLVKSGETDDVYTNALNRTYKTALPNPALNVGLDYSWEDGVYDEMTGGKDRYIWNAYSNITISGFSVAGVNGTYSYVTNARFVRNEDSTNRIDMILDHSWTDLGSSDQIYVYTNGASPTRYLFDRGPRDSAGKKAPGDNTRSCAIVRSTYTRDAVTYRGDSPFNGPWFTWTGMTPVTNVVVTGSGFSSNLLREAICRWYINKSGPWAVYGDYEWHSYDGVTPAYEDPRYWRWGLNALGADLKSYQLDTIEDKLWMWVDPAYFAPVSLIQVQAFLDHHQASAGTFTGITNYQGWVDLCLNWTGVCVNAGISQVYTNHQPPTTGDVDRLSKALKEFQWSWDGHAFDPWMIPGELTNTVPCTNNYVGWGQSYTSWAAAKADAEANLRPDSSYAWAPYSYTYGHYGATVYPTVTTKVWAAYIYTSADDAAYKGACTSIVHTADIYVLANKYAGLSYTNNVFDGNGVSGLVEGEYVKVATVGPSSDPFPLTTIGTIGAVPAWCDDPALHTVRTDYGDHYVLLGGSVQGFQIDDAVVVLKWGWNYNP
jgi:hypothetical protein